MIFQLFLSFLVSYITVVLFNFYNLGKPSIRPRQFKTWFKVIALALPIYFVVNAISQTGWFYNIEFGVGVQNLPEYLTFFATVLSVYLLYRTLTNQRKADQISAFENRFFKFMDYHRENVSQLLYRDPKSKGERYWQGNQVFTIIFYEICDLLRQINAKVELTTREQKMEAVDFAYQCVFYGAGEHGMEILRSNFLNHRYFKFIDFERKTAAYGMKIWSPNKEKYYSGHVRRLGHYFRNIYQAVKYVEDQDFLTEAQKYDYTKHFRAQMSVYEQSVFFFNSLSTLGSVWEWENFVKPCPKNSKEAQKVYPKLLITKYDLVRNTLNNDGIIFNNISITEFYPLVSLERHEEASVYGKLPFLDNKKNLCRFCFNEKYVGYIDRKSKQKTADERVHYFANASIEELKSFSCDERSCKSTKVRDKILRQKTK